MKKVKQNETQFSPNPNMLKLLEAAINPEVEANISSWCEAAGVSRVQWYRWKEIRGFLDWFNSEYKKALDGIKVSLVKVGLQKALSGDFQFWKVMMEKIGEYTHEMSHQIKTDPPVVINITQEHAKKIMEAGRLTKEWYKNG